MESLRAAFEEAERSFDDEGRAACVIAAIRRYQQAGAQEKRELNAFFGPRAKIVLLMAMRVIEAGDGQLGEYYLSQFLPEHLQQVNMLPSFLYWYGRAAYARGKWARAAALFEKHRTLVPHDERAAFYAGNAYAHLGDWARARTSWQTAVQENNGFYEPRANLERGGLPLAAEQVTSFDLSELLSQPARCYDVPIFINARDRVGCLRQLVDWLCAAGYRKIHILDNDSTYPPLRVYYEELRQKGISVWYLRRNLGYKALWQSGILNLLRVDTAYVYTDPDVVPDAQCPRDIVYQLAVLLSQYPYLSKFGLTLHTEDLTFYNRRHIEVCENGLRLLPVRDGYFMPTDTTFALYRNRRIYTLQESMRTRDSLRARHLPWYYDFAHLPEDERYYMEHADGTSSVTRHWREDSGPVLERGAENA